MDLCTVILTICVFYFYFRTSVSFFSVQLISFTVLLTSIKLSLLLSVVCQFIPDDSRPSFVDSWILTVNRFNKECQLPLYPSINLLFVCDLLNQRFS